VNYDEARIALQQAGEEGRSQALWLLTQIVQDPSSWKSFGKPFIQQAWPREARFQSASSSRQFALLAQESGKHFPDVVQTILPLLVPADNLDLVVFQLKKDNGQDGTSIVSTFPAPLLSLLERLVPDDVRWAPHDLGSVLSRIADAAPRLRQDQRWRRLSNIVNRS
jgi:hypothetical protein